MNLKRLQFLIIIGVSVGAIGLVLVYVANHPEPRQRVAALKNGMPRAEVERLLGGPPAQYGRPPQMFAAGELYGPGENSYCVVWGFNGLIVYVRFDFTDKLIEVESKPTPEVTLLETIEYYLSP